MYKRLKEELVPQATGSERWTFVNATSTNEERRDRYILLRAAGYSVAEARAMRDYRDHIIQKRFDIIEAARRTQKDTTHGVD